jgi:nucleoside-diphosphate-sugar epimerase
LITGATGFLGAAVALEALRQVPAHELLLLARAPTPALALQRLRANLQRHGADADMLAAIGEGQVLCADLEDLSACQHDPRIDEVRLVVHCAALATFSNHPSLEKFNVQGTRNLAQLVRGRPGLQRFCFIGTAMACGAEAEVSNGLVSELEQLPVCDAHLVPYTRSKALAERLLREEFPDLPVVMLRPSIIVGDTRHGCSASQSIFWVFQVAQMLGAFTVDLDARVDVVPVDWCARAILDLATRPVLRHRVYHLSAGQDSCATFREIDLALARARGIEPMGESYRRVGHEDLRQLLPKMRKFAPGCNDRLLMRALRLYGGFAALSYVFSNLHTTSEGIAPAPRFPDYIGLCHDSARDVPISEQMAWDFK